MPRYPSALVSKKAIFEPSHGIIPCRPLYHGLGGAFLLRRKQRYGLDQSRHKQELDGPQHADEVKTKYDE